MDASAVMGYLTSRQWAMDPQHLRAIAEAISIGLERVPADTLRAAQERAAARSSGASSSSRRAYDLRDGVAHIRVSGVVLKEVPCIFELLDIPATSTLAVQRALDDALYDDSVRAIEIDIDSPGGSLAGVQELADAVFAARDLKPVSAHASDLIASAAYWIGSQASRLTANETAFVGSIGVYAVLEDSSAAFEGQGVKVHVIRSHELKGVGIEGAAVTAPQIADEQRLINEAADLFVAAVARGRGLDSEYVRTLATGQVWFAAEAKARQLIDAIASSHQAHDSAKENTMPPSTTTPKATENPSAPAAESTPAAAPAPTPAAPATETPAADELKAARDRGDSLATKGREMLLEKYSDRVAPADLAAIREFGAFCGDNLDKFEAHLKARPPVTRPARVSDAGGNEPASAPGPSAQQLTDEARKYVAEQEKAGITVSASEAVRAAKQRLGL